MIKQITIAVDFSEPSLVAARFGVALTRAFGAHATLVHVIEGQQPVAGPAGLLERLEGGLLASRHARLYEVGLELELTDEPETFRSVVRRGGVCFGLLAAAAEQAADLIVIGSTGAHQEDILALGSVAAQVARAATAPVLVVSESHLVHLHEGGLFTRPLVAIDHSRASEPSIVATSLLAEPLAPIELCHVIFHPTFESDDQDVAALEALFEETRAYEVGRLRELAARSNLDRQFKTQVETGRAAAAITARALAIRADLIVTGAHGRATPGDVVLGTVATRLLRQSPCPVLLIPEAVIERG